MQDSELLADFRSFAVTKLAEYMSQIRRCAGLLSDEQTWRRPNEHSNSIGNLLLHLRGNLTQWILAGLGGQEFDRDRPSEFAQRDTLPTAKITAALQRTVEDASRVISELSGASLAGPADIQGYKITGMTAVFHVVEHFAFHTGQIIYWTKAMLDVDLSLYDAQGHRLDQRSTGAP